MSTISDELRVLNSLSSQTPKHLGYSWETGQLEDHVKIDDGLEKPFYLPLDLCSTPEVILNSVIHLIQLTSLGLYKHSLSEIQVKKTSWVVTNSTRTSCNSRLERKRPNQFRQLEVNGKGGSRN